jgi:peptide deformylase
MAQLPIIEYPDPLLRHPAATVAVFDDDLSRLIDDLLDTLGSVGGIGLAAPQVGTLSKVVVVHVPDDDHGAQAYVNPSLLERSTPGLVEEGCMSLPGVVGNVVRATQVTVRAQDRDGRWFERALSGMHAVCLQHEMDHLEGKLFIDRLSWFKRWRIKSAFSRDVKRARNARR